MLAIMGFSVKFHSWRSEVAACLASLCLHVKTSCCWHRRAIAWEVKSFGSSCHARTWRTWRTWTPQTPPHKQELTELNYDMNWLRNEASPGRNIENEASNCAWFGVKRQKTQWDIKHVHGTCEDLNSFQISWCVLSVSSLNDNHPLQPISLCHSLRKTLKHLESHFKTC